MLVPAGDRAVVIRDFNAMRRHIFFVFNLKFGHWGGFPWILFGTAHHVDALSRRITRYALQLYDALVAGCEVHWIVVFMLSYGSRCRAEMIAFVNTGTVAVGGVFARMRGRLRFALTSERWFEALQLSNHDERNKNSTAIMSTIDA